jgi:6-phosphogluconate dehydrogenase
MDNQIRPESGFTTYDIGMIGLGVMGRNFLLNIADHGLASAGYDTNDQKVRALNEEGSGKKVRGVDRLPDLLKILKKPRIIMMLVPAGKAVDTVINELVPHLEKGDIIIDGGNSHFTDTNRHSEELTKKGINFFGVGVSGGEKGARFGPSIMPGGPKDAYKEVKQIFEKTSAKVNGEPCVAYLGPGSAGHYVKMVHNGIEYALIQLISETYHLMKQVLNFSNDELHKVYKEWNEGELQSFLVEIAADIFLQPDDKSGNRLIDMILDAAKQKGTGKWTSQDAMELQLPIPTIDSAVEMRDMSVFKSERETASKILNGPKPDFKGNRKNFVDQLRNAFYLGMIVSYAQGMALIRLASKQYNYGIDLQEVAKIWRGGCIIRSRFLENIRSSYKKNSELLNLMIEPETAKLLGRLQNDLRAVITEGIKWGIPVPALASSLSYYDSYRSAWLPANLIQAQRDYFGSHTYERIDQEGVFHTIWNESSGGK